MSRILITGMSGTGKTAVIRELAARGYPAHDLDTPEWSEWVEAAASDELTPVQGKDWVWREGRVRALLAGAGPGASAGAGEGTLFVSGCAENMHRLFPLIECIILLTAPVETILERLETRAPGGYGHVPDERRKVLALIATVEPLLRESADREIDTRKPVRVTADEILQISGGLR